MLPKRKALGDITGSTNLDAIPPPVKKRRALKKVLTEKEQKFRIQNLPEPPAFDFFESPHPAHDAEPKLPPEFDPTPLNIFELFFTEEVLQMIAENTNQYAEFKRGNPSTGEENLLDTQSFVRNWKSVTVAELKIFLGLQIHMGIYRFPALNLYWSKNVKHAIFEKMSLVRYEQIKRFFHLSPVSNTPAPNKEWWKKMEPVASDLRRKFMEIYLPASDLSYDEMMVCFQGRSMHIIKQPGKPIDHGYKLWALYERGYTWAFLFYSGAVGTEKSVFTQKTDSYANINNETAEKIFRFNKLEEQAVTTSGKPKRSADMRFTLTQQAVCTLVFQLTFDRYRFNIYMDNYFTTIPPFRYLRMHGIGAVGTTQPSRHEFPPEFDITKGIAKSILEWNFLSGKIERNVCVVLWQDNNTVLFLTTIHNIRSLVLSYRRKPSDTSTNAKQARKPFKDNEDRKLLPIPELVVDYNNKMGGVDIADQLRSNYGTHQKCWRNWLALWF